MKLYNTLTRQKEEFVPITPGEVKMYSCGPTVYNYFHIGNARPFVVFDTLRKYLEYRGYNVKFVQNFTDVDDKIINKAREEGVPAGEVSEKYIEEYYKDAASLNVKKATVHPKVTENMDQIIAFVKDLIDLGYAYEVDGDVYYSTRAFKEYGKLSGQNIEDLEAGARIEVGEKKKDPLDFALWKARKTEDEWEGPDGTLNAPLCQNGILEIRLIFMRGDKIWRFPTMRTKLLSPKPIVERSSRTIGCTTVILLLTMKRCPNPKGIFLQYGTS